MFRLLLEYARIIDDNRVHLGYSGDGGELDTYDGLPAFPSLAPPSNSSTSVNTTLN